MKAKKKIETSPTLGRSSLNIVRMHFPGVTTCQDATEDVEIEVLPKDVQTNKRKSFEGCAFARACKRSLEIDGAIISTTRAYLVVGNTATRYNVPHAIQKEITSFDRGASFEPGMYRLKAMRPNERYGARKKYNPSNGRDDGSIVGKRHVTENVRSLLVR